MSILTSSESVPIETASLILGFFFISDKGDSCIFFPLDFWETDEVDDFADCYLNLRPDLPILRLLFGLHFLFMVQFVFQFSELFATDFDRLC